MSDLISRKAVIDVITNAADKWDCSDDYQRGIKAGIRMGALFSSGIPAAQPESKTGKWIEAYDPFNRISGRCSVCGWEAHLYEDDVVGMNYCPNCGSYNGGKN